MQRILKILFLLFIATATACTSQQIGQTIGDVLKTDNGLTEGQVSSGLKEALINGVKNSSSLASKLDGYLKNDLIKIPFPPEISQVEDRLQKMGLGKITDKFVVSLNRGAEKAAGEAAPIFISAVKSMSINDAWNILKGGDNAATNFLKSATEAQLIEKFKPIIGTSLESVEATKFYDDVVNTYNKIPLVRKVDPNLQNYATTQAVDGLFKLIALEEGKIREDPMARTSDLLKKVFDKGNWN